jgi:GNAT superfamily N-acetyltransferase
VSLRPAGPEDAPFLLEVYGSVRSGELAATDWTDSQKAQFVDVIVLDGQPVGRLYVARWSDEVRIVDIALLPAYCNRGLGTTLLRAPGGGRRQPEAASYPCRAFQSCAEALRAARVLSGRRSRSLSVHGMAGDVGVHG